MENKNVNIKEKISEELGLMLGEIAMIIGQQHQNYIAIAEELKSRMPKVTSNCDIGKTPIEAGSDKV
jgi:hypothetical protein